MNLKLKRLFYETLFSQKFVYGYFPNNSQKFFTVIINLDKLILFCSLILFETRKIWLYNII